MLYKFQSDRTHRIFEQVLHRIGNPTAKTIVSRCELVTDQAEGAAAKGCPIDSVAATNGRVIYLDSNRLIDCPADFVEAAIAHEFGHIALGHVAGGAKAHVDDDAADREVDEWCGRFGFRRLVKEGAAMSRFQYPGLPKTFGEVQF